MWAVTVLLLIGSAVALVLMALLGYSNTGILILWRSAASSARSPSSPVTGAMVECSRRRTERHQGIVWRASSPTGPDTATTTAQSTLALPALTRIQTDVGAAVTTGATRHQRRACLRASARSAADLGASRYDGSRVTQLANQLANSLRPGVMGSDCPE